MDIADFIVKFVSEWNRRVSQGSHINSMKGNLLTLAMLGAICNFWCFQKKANEGSADGYAKNYKHYSGALTQMQYMLCFTSGPAIKEVF